MINDIKEQVKAVIKYSQDIEEPKVDGLIEEWAEAKKEFIDVFGGFKGVYGLNEPNGADGDEVFEVKSRVFKASGDVNNKAQIVLGESLLCFFVACLHGEYRLLLIVAAKRRRENVTSADVE